MCRLIESIKIKNNTIFNLKYHNLRMNDARKRLFNINNFIDLNKIIKLPNSMRLKTNNPIKCRLHFFF